ncbi:cell division ATP-binding protein FtsE [Candidatus Gottesmanbacteria bacterium]|nr:cell division ATP-binding protein FtsE [Candidatus Gottesmanbacteria bacterium]
MINFNNVSKYYPGKVPGLVDVTLEIPAGDFVFLIGPSGSGKTTFLRLLIRDLVASAGTLTIDETDVSRLTSSNLYLLRRKVGIVFQDFKLLLDRTVFENVAMVLEILGKPDKEIEQGVMNVLQLVGLADKKNLFPMQLSAGEMQRTAIARAIVGGPKILLADEPTGNLDPDTAWGIMDILQEIHGLGTTVIVASHNADIVNKMRKRTLTVQHGKVVRDEAKGHYHLEKHTKSAKGGKHDAAH